MDGLFNGLITIENREKYHELIYNIDSAMAIKILEIAIMHGQSSGLFNLQESHCLYECLKKLENKD